MSHSYHCHSCCPGFSDYFYNEYWNETWSVSGDRGTTRAEYSLNITGCNETCKYILVTTTRYRVWPESSICGAVPTRRLTWGSLKQLYR
jgi:hypothetical protein